MEETCHTDVLSDCGCTLVLSSLCIYVHYARQEKHQERMEPTEAMWRGLLIALIVASTAS